MERCWEREPSKRPKFKEIEKKLSEMVSFYKKAGSLPPPRDLGPALGAASIDDGEEEDDGGDGGGGGGAGMDGGDTLAALGISPAQITESSSGYADLVPAGGATATTSASSNRDSTCSLEGFGAVLGLD
jgi:hypothetical protein